MSYTIRDEDLPRVIVALRKAADDLAEKSCAIFVNPAHAETLKRASEDCTRLADEMEAEG